MDLNFRPVEAEDMSRLRPFYGLRPNRTCDSVFLDSFLWKDYYKVECAVSEDKAVLWLMEKDGRHASLQGRRSSIFLLSDGRLF